MPPIKREMYTKSQKFAELDMRSNELKEENDCAVKALAIVTGITYDEARINLEKRGRKAGKGTIRNTLYEAINEAGFEQEVVSGSHFIERYPPPHNRCKKFVTTHHMDTFPEIWKDGHTYLLHTRRHVLAVVDGVNHDWTRGTSKRAWKIVRIIKKETL